jgi:tRNA pseudouridine55 synthase
VTNTGDAEGEVISQGSAANVSREQLVEALKGFEGEISQVPSMYSALKHKGQPLYKLAREGKVVEREARQVMIYSLELIDFRPGEQAEVDLDIHCSKGTYVRSIAEDLGEVLGCGAHVSALHRTQAGPYTESEAVSLDDMEAMHEQKDFAALNALLLPMESSVLHLPQVTLVEANSFYLRQGQPVMVPNAPTEGLVRLMSEDNGFLGVGEILDDGRVGPRRLIVSQENRN